MAHSLPIWRKPVLVAATLVLIAGSGTAGADVYNGITLDIPALKIGTTTLSDVVVTVGAIVSGPSGTSSSGTVDTYDPTTGYLNIPAVGVGSQLYYNVVIKVGKVVSIGNVSGADSYDGKDLQIAAVQVGPTVYKDVLLAVKLADVVGVAGNLPSALVDIYNASSGELLIPAVKVGTTVYTNVTVRATPADVVSIGAGGGSSGPTLTVLHSFEGTDGEGPWDGLAFGTDGDLYGTTTAGGTGYVASSNAVTGNGTIFKVSPAGAWTNLHLFSDADGQYSTAGLVLAADGNFYGTTEKGGANGVGTVFKVTPGGALTTIYSFCAEVDCTDGQNPKGGLIQGSDGNLYGTTAFAGNPDASGGTAFRITPAGVLTTIYSFCSVGGGDCTDGANPQSGLVQGGDGNFYGTTYYGGANNNTGTIFQLTPGGVLNTLYSFGGAADSAFPVGGLIRGSDGNWWGTTSGGTISSPEGKGAIFKITPGGVFTTVYSFSSNTAGGAYPRAGLLLGSDGNYYGTAMLDGKNGNGGTIFQITPDGTYTTLYSFCSVSACADGAAPLGSLVEDSAGNLYGTTSGGGANRYGTVFKLSGPISTTKGNPTHASTP
jgi:uncharacterized repeat protein (TIGR03803 family)